ncbi:MAG: alpha/beta fold hydrolase [Nocardioides sp.]
MDIILIAGLWLDGSAWDAVVPELEARGHRPVPLTLPGQGDRGTGATLDDQAAAVLAAVDATEGRPLVVGHSAACGLAWIAADRRADKVGAVALIGGMPAADGSAYADFFEAVGDSVPFPGWEPFDGPDADDLDEELRRRIAATAIPVPTAVTRGIVRLTDPRRYAVPVVMVCPEFSVDQAREWIAAGDIPELSKAADVSFVDIDSGHWPMFSKPVDLARLIADLCDEPGPQSRRLGTKIDVSNITDALDLLEGPDTR